MNTSLIKKILNAVLFFIYLAISTISISISAQVKVFSLTKVTTTETCLGEYIEINRLLDDHKFLYTVLLVEPPLTPFATLQIMHILKEQKKLKDAKRIIQG